MKSHPRSTLVSLVLWCTLCVSTQGQGQPPDEATPEEIEVVLNTHNYFRRQRGASDMEHMTWNSELAAKAVELSQTCVFEHDMIRWDNAPYPSVGQNLALGSDPAYDDAITRWHDNEINNYNYDADTCSGVCGHYTQVVWSASREVGCGRHFCALAITHEGREYRNVYMVTCNYGPPGNYPTRPYQVGPPCTACVGGNAFCSNGLCDGDCSEPDCSCVLDCGAHGTLNAQACSCTCDQGYEGNLCNEACDDHDEQCGANPGWPKYFCDQWDVVYTSCPKLCGLCLPASGEVGCVDTHEYCTGSEGWPESWCTDPDYLFVRDYCPKMCGTCTT